MPGKDDVSQAVDGLNGLGIKGGIQDVASGFRSCISWGCCCAWWQTCLLVLVDGGGEVGIGRYVLIQTVQLQTHNQQQPQQNTPSQLMLEKFNHLDTKYPNKFCHLLPQSCSLSVGSVRAIKIDRKASAASPTFSK